MKRRHFICCALGSAGVGYLGWQATNRSRAEAGVGRLTRCVRSTRALGTDVRCTVYAPTLAAGEEAIAAAFAEIERVESLMSLYREDSQLSRLNREGRRDQPDPDLVRVLRSAADLSQRSGGAFDITVQPLWELHAGSAQSGLTPAAAEIDAARRHVDWRRVGVADAAIQLPAGTRLTLNGIAQGFAADVACRALKAHGITSAILDTGEVGLIGTHAGKDHWTVGIKHPRRPGELLGSVQLRDRCFATSGDYETRFTEDYQSHHLFDPHTGRSATTWASVSVAAPDALQADAYSTALFVMDREAGRELIQATPGVDALFVAKDGRITRSAGFPEAALKTI